MAAQRGSRPGMPAAVAPPAPVHPKLADFGITPLAKGGMGNVFKAVRRADNRIFALKQVNLNKMSTVDRQTAIDEARVLAQLNHPHVIKYYDSFIDSEKNLNILMEYAAGGDLANILRRSPGKPLPEEFLWKLFIQTLIGLAHIHGKRIIHRDIKALNIFFDSKGNVKIGDMGVARPLSADSNMANSKVGTIFYLSPELCNDKPYSFKSDIWALGVVMYECMMGRYPFDAQNTGAALRKIIDGRMQPLSGPYTPQLLSIVKECLTYKPEARPDATALLRHATLLSKAKALGVSLNPQPSKEDVPMYEQLQPQQQQQMPQYGGSPGPGPSPHGQYAYQPQQQGGYSPGRPMSAGARPGASPYQQQSPQQQNGYAPPYGSPYGAGQAPPDHPFALAGASPGGAGAGPASPGAYIGAYAAQGPGAPPHQYPYQQPQQQQQQHRPGGYGSPQQQAPPDRGNYTPQGNRNPHDPWDNLAADIHKVHISDTERARNNQDRIQNLAANAHAGQRDNLKGLLYAGGADSGPKPQRVKPEGMPAAGGRPASAHAGQAPFALHHEGDARYNSMANAHSTDAWRASYQPPQYGRRRCPELQITGPSLRGGSARPGGGGGGGGYAADDATSYVSTSYAAQYQR